MKIIERNRDLDALIAEKIMGKKLFFHKVWSLDGNDKSYLETIGPFLNSQEDCRSVNIEVPHYSQDPVEAVKVLEKLREVGIFIQLTATPDGYEGRYRDEIVQAMSLPEAICKLALEVRRSLPNDEFLQGSTKRSG